MMARTIEKAPEGRWHGDGLPGSATNTSASVGLGGIISRDLPDSPAIRQNRRLRLLGPPLESSGRPTAVLGQSVYPGNPG